MTLCAICRCLLLGNRVGRPPKYCKPCRARAWSGNSTKRRYLEDEAMFLSLDLAARQRWMQERIQQKYGVVPS